MSHTQEAKLMPRTSPLQAVVVMPEQAAAIKPFGLDMKILLASEATGGALSVIMAWHKPGEGPPAHAHSSQEEIFFVIDGFYELTVGDETTGIGPGAIVFIPRNVVHRFRNIGNTTGCMLDWSLPGGQDRYFNAISDAGGKFTGRQAAKISGEFNTTFPVLS